MSKAGEEMVRAFVPHPLPPRDPPLCLDDKLIKSLNDAMAAIGRLAVAAVVVPSAEWFLHGFVRKEAVISSQIEGTQATLEDVIAYEATERAEHVKDVRKVCNYLAALDYARREMSRPKGLPLSTRLGFICPTAPPLDSTLRARTDTRRSLRPPNRVGKPR